jgi:hypothetical protein
VPWPSLNHKVWKNSGASLAAKGSKAGLKERLGKAAGSATQVPGLDMVVDAGAEWLINGWNKGKEGDQSQ